MPTAWQSLSPVWRHALLGVAAGWFVLLVAWHDTFFHWLALVSANVTYSHALLVPLIAIWLVWRQKDVLALHTPRPSALGGLYLLIASLLWFAGTVAEVRLIQHIALFMGFQGVAASVLGLGIVRVLAFPVAFLLLAVPFGESLVPVLQTVTARSVVAALDASGVLIRSEGVLITTSTGTYEVAQACAGVKFLFAGAVAGLLLAHLVSRRWWKRVVIFSLGILLPVIGNAGRVYTTLMLAEWLDASLAQGVKHYIYGMVAFYLMLLLLILIAYRMADGRMLQAPHRSDTQPDTVKDSRSPVMLARVWLFTPLVTALFAAFILPPVHGVPRGGVTTDCPVSLPPPDHLAYARWRPLPEGGGVTWPHEGMADHTFRRIFRRDDMVVFLQIDVFAFQGGVKRYDSPDSGVFTRGWRGLPAVLKPAKDADTHDFGEFLAWRGNKQRLYWRSVIVGGRQWQSGTGARFGTVLSRFNGQGGRAAVVTLFVEGDTHLGRRPDAARQALADFASGLHAAYGAELIRFSEERGRPCAVSRVS